MLAQGNGIDSFFFSLFPLKFQGILYLWHKNDMAGLCKCLLCSLYESYRSNGQCRVALWDNNDSKIGNIEPCARHRSDISIIQKICRIACVLSFSHSCKMLLFPGKNLADV